MRNWLDRKFIGAKFALKNALYEEKGDTNFISIIIILAVALTVAGVFIGYKDRIMGKFQQQIEEFLK